MKKICLLFMVMWLVLCGCSNNSSENILKDVKNKINNSKSFIALGTMEISNDEETFSYNLESYYLKDDYYKVVLVNQTSNHEQIILKNKEDVYVITPALNKSFKFQSEWPNNSSQAYLLNSLSLDIENDKDSTITEDGDGYVIKTAVNYPNNPDLKYQKIYVNSDKVIEKVEVYNESDIVKIKVELNDITFNADLKEEDFVLEKYIKETDDESNKNTENTKCDSEKEKCDNQESIDSEKKTVNIENIIYPLYIPSNTHLSSSEKIDTGSGNRIILTFSGEKNFVLIEEASIANENMEIIPVYGEPFMLSETVGALSANSLSWEVNNISYYLASTELSVEEMKSIANSLGNETLFANTK